ncbi:MAG: response regulator [Bacteroidetes bacterium]|nr:response regulator [Bacteroidota bacterium]
MTFRQIILSGISLFICLLLADSIYTYYRPEIINNKPYLFIKIFFFVSFGISGIYTVFALRKNLSLKLKSDQREVVTEKSYRQIVEESGIITISTDVNGIIKFVSRNVEKLTNYTPQEMRGLHVTQCMPREFRQQVNELIKNTAANKAHKETIEIQIFTKQRINKWIGCRLYNITDESGNLKELQFMLWDNDHTKQMELDLKLLEEARRKQQKLLQAVVDNNPNIIYVKNLKGEYLLTNKKLNQFSGLADTRNLLTEQEVFKTQYHKLSEYRLQDKKVMETGEMVAFEDEVIMNGESAFYYIMKFPIFDDAGNVDAICGVSIDITELKKTQIAMHEAREEALQAKEAQETFLANMSHEIRTPMNGVMGMSNLLLETRMTDAQKEYVQSIKESAENLLNIINDLLDFSKIKSGKFHIDADDFNIADTIRKAIYPLQVKAQEKNLVLNCYIDTNVPEIVTGDSLRLQQMIINLAGNAVKFTQHGSITVKLYPIEQSDNHIILGIDVSDTGIGIPADKLDKVFELYTQSDKDTSRVYGGTGLGLAIVKQLAELQNGNITVTSEPGKGSTFTIRIPYKTRQQTTHQQNAVKGSIASGLLNGLHILVAEDNLINQKVVVYTLKNQGADVTVANNGKEAVHALSENNYHLILMDLQMPEMDGYQATRHIRSEMNSAIPIIAMTADAMKGESDKCIAAGMQDYISKPFEPKELFNKILHYANTGSQ